MTDTNEASATNGTATDGTTTTLTPEARMRQDMFQYVYEHPYVQQWVNRYNRTKTDNPLMGFALQGVENQVVNVANYAMPAYEYYLQPKVDAVHAAVNKSVENTKRAVDLTRSTAVTTTTLGIGAAVVVSQMIISLGLTGTNWLLDTVISLRQKGGIAVGQIKDSEKMVEERFREYLQQANNVAQIPLSKFTDHANTFLDIANRVMDRLLGVEGETDPVDCTIGNRLYRMARRFSQVLHTRAHDNIIDPVSNQMHIAMEQLRSYLKLVDYVRERKEWVAQRVDRMQASVNDLKANIEKQANDLMSRPEEILMQSVRNTSLAVIENVNALKERGNKLLGENVVSKLDSVVDYLNNLEHTFSEVNNIYELRDEVLCEARTKLTDFVDWTSSLLVRKDSLDETNSSTAVEPHETTTSSEGDDSPFDSSKSDKEILTNGYHENGVGELNGYHNGSIGECGEAPASGASQVYVSH